MSEKYNIKHESSKLAITHGEKFSKKEFFNCETLADYLQTTIVNISDAKIINVGFPSQKLCTTTYQKLWHNSLHLLSLLQQQKLDIGNYVIIIAENPWELISSVWSCWLGGYIPIPIQFSQTQPQQVDFKIREACKIDDRAAPLRDRLVIITNNQINNYLQQQGLLSNSNSVIILEYQNEITNVDHHTFHRSQPEDIGALFFTSGTTGKPKLVSFTCETILNRLIENYPLNIHNSNYLYWLPFDHASACLRIVNPNALQKVILSTDAFIQNPLLWLETVNQYAIKQTQMTNFGMALIYQALQDNDDTSHWNLSSVQSVGIGAETIMPHTFKTFLSALQPFNLKDNIFFVGYGLTECGTIVTGLASLIKIPSSNQQCMLLGKPCRGYSIRIVDNEGAIVNEDTIGNVQIIGPATIEKYYNQNEKDSNLFTEDGWLKTGDNGFLHEGSLAITGRKKDTIIINGKNYSPQIIEEVINSSLSISDTVAVAIRYPDSITDELVVFFATENMGENLDTMEAIDSVVIDIIKQIKMTIVKELNITPSHVIPLAKSYIPRTASGKVKRQQLVNFFHEGKYNHLVNKIEIKINHKRKNEYTQAESKIEKQLQILWLNLFKLKDIGIQENFFYLGGNSLLASQLISKINEQFQTSLPINSLWENPTIYLFSQYLETNLVQNTNCEETSLIKIINTGNKTPLYFINSTTVAYDVSQYLDAQQPLYSLNIFGLTTRVNQPFETLTMTDFAQYLIKDLLDFQPTGSYKLIAFCQDGALALEIAQQLQQMGKQVDTLILIDVLFKKEELKFSDRLKLIYHFGIPYLKLKFKNLLKSQKSKNYNVENNIEDIKLTEKVALDKQLYQAYFKQAEKYNPQKYNGKILSLLSKEWSHKRQNKLKSISETKIETLTIESPHNFIFHPTYIRNFIIAINIALNYNTDETN